MVRLVECETCSAAVTDSEKHEQWHNEATAPKKVEPLGKVSGPFLPPNSDFYGRTATE